MMSILDTDLSVCKNAQNHIYLTTGGIKNPSFSTCFSRPFSAISEPKRLMLQLCRYEWQNPELTPVGPGFHLKKRAGVVLIN